MTARLFSRFEPLSDPDDPARAIAAFFFVVAGIGAAPGLYGLLMMGAAFAASLADPSPISLAALAMLSFIVLGFIQMWFYFRRAIGGRGRLNARAWWLSTYFYNLVPVGVSIAMFVNDPHIGAVASALWFAALCTFALVAHGNERR